MSCRLLDNFPVELIHHLLSYFSTHEIFYTFTNVSTYIDDVLRNYSSYSVNLKSIPRRDFEIICQRIIPDQVISLTLSDDEETPGQLERFLSRFQINQFTRLRSLTIIDVGADFWEVIMTKLIDLHQLRSFIYEPANTIHSWVCDIPDENVTELDQRLFHSYSPVLPQLNRLKLSHGDFLGSVQFRSLRHLFIRKCKIDILQRISQTAVQLKSLEVILECNQSNIEFNFSFKQLIQLILKVEGADITMNNMERLLSKLVHLKSLELHGRGGDDLVSGQRWQSIIHHLQTFNFMISLSSDIDVNHLDSFRSPFWLITKKWYVAYNTSDFLFTVPYFARTRGEEKFQPPILSTVPDPEIFHRCITRLTLSSSVFKIKHRFSQVDVLVLSVPIAFALIEEIIDINRIQRLILSSKKTSDGISLIINALPNLHRITFIDNIKYFLSQLTGTSFPKIQSLEIGSYYSLSAMNTTCNRYDSKKLASIFPCVKHLHIRHQCSTMKMLGFIRRFQQLNNASFRFTQSYLYSESIVDLIAEIQSSFEKYQTAQRHDFTYRFGTQSVYVWL